MKSKVLATGNLAKSTTLKKSRPKIRLLVVDAYNHIDVQFDKNDNPIQGVLSGVILKRNTLSRNRISNQDPSPNCHDEMKCRQDNFGTN